MRDGDEPLPQDRNLRRVLIVGSTCAGKSTFSRNLAQRLDRTRVELDELYWGPDWTPKPREQFRELVETAAAGEHWVVEGNYREVRDLLWPRATTVFWLNYPFHIVLMRALKRTTARSFMRRTLWHGNRESLARAFLSRESIILYMIQNWGHRRRQFAVLRNSAAYPQLCWVEFRRPSQAAAYLWSLAVRADAGVAA